MASMMERMGISASASHTFNCIFGRARMQILKCIFRNPSLWYRFLYILLLISHEFNSCQINLIFRIYSHNSFATGLSTNWTWIVTIFMSRIPESGFLSGCPVFQKVHIWNLHVMGSFQVQKFSRTNLVRGPVLLRNDGFLIFSKIHHIYTYKTIWK